jgi:hypothetical protein
MKRTLLSTLLLCGLLATASPAAVVFDQPHNGTGTVQKSSWYAPDGLDGDMYVWDSFTLGASAAISQVHWRGGYLYHPSGAGQAPVTGFDLSIYRSIGGNSQPDMGTGGRLVHYAVIGAAGETDAGSFGGTRLYDYAFTLPSPFQAAAGTVYWVEIVASQGAAAPSYAPDWGLAVGSGGNNSHFQFTTGANYQLLAGDAAFSLLSSSAPTVTIAANAAPAGAGSVTGAGAYPVGSTAALAATANPGWGFLQWTEGATTVSTNAAYSFTANANRTLVANFDTAYTVTTSAYPPYAGTIAGGGTYTRGTSVPLVATPAHGFVFTSWSDGATTAAHAFPASADVRLTAFFDSAPDAVTFDFDGGPYQSPLPIDWTVNGVTGRFTGGHSTQQVGTLGIAPDGMYGWYLYPGSVYQSDLGIAFSEPMTDFSIRFAVDELGCDTSARMRVTAYLAGAFVATNTAVAPVPGTYPAGTLAITPPAPFDSVVVHWDAPGTACQDYGPIFFADNVTVTRANPPVGGVPVASRGGVRLAAPAPNPFRVATAVAYTLPRAGNVSLALYDMSGRRVRWLANGAQPAGAHSLAWDGRDDAGRRVSPGIYVMQLQAAGARDHRRVVLLR